MRRVLAALAATLLLASCTPETSTSDPGTGATTEVARGRVDVASPAMRALKAKAGVEPCAPGVAANELPKVVLPCLGGGQDVDLARLRGPLVVNLFAQWCSPCRAELPHFQRLHRESRGRIQVLGVDYLDPRPELALELVRATGVTFPLVADPAGTLRVPFRIRGLPGMVLVDERGKVVDVQFRVFRSYAELRAVVQRGLGVALPA